ncbi:MAG: AAA family ATPase, partial [bacterium]
MGRPSNYAGVDDIAILLHGREVLVVGERDGKPDGSWPGRDGAMKTAGALASRWGCDVGYALPPKGAKDLRAYLHAAVADGLRLDAEEACRETGRALLEELRASVEVTCSPTGPSSSTASGPRVPRLRSFDQIPRTNIEWLWPGRIPRGKLVLLTGDPGTGKSTLTLDLAARVSRGRDWPDGEECERGAVLLLSAEDDAEDTIGPRLDAAGADTACVVQIELPPADRGSPQSGASLVGLGDLVALEETLKAGLTLPGGETIPFRLVVIDPLTAFLDGVDAHRNNEVRGALHPLSEFAERLGLTVLIIVHPRKGQAQNPLDMVAGSRAFVEAVRASWYVTRDP